MARAQESDPLAVFAFWLMDLGPTDSLNLPIFTPLFGFSSVTAPEIQIETSDIVEGNWLFVRKVVKRASCSSIRLARGVLFYDSDFWRWFITALAGSTSGQNVIPGLGFAALPIPILQIGGPTYRRNFLLVQYFPKAVFTGPSAAPGAASIGVTAGLLSGVAGLSPPSAAGLIATTAMLTAAAMNVGPFEFAARVPAKAWMLLDCIPTRYKAGGDFEASSSAISIQEVEFAVERVEEVSLAG